MNITITGNLGSGKSTVCKELEAMGYEIISVGKLFRQMAAEKGMTVNEFNKYAEGTDIDKQLDDRTILLGNQMDNVIFDSRLAWHFLPNSFKVFLLVSPNEAARRVADDTERTAENYASKEESLKSILERTNLEESRYQDLYQVHYNDLSNYDLVIESTCASPKEIAKEIIRNFLLYQEAPFHKVELNLKNLYPTKPMKDFDTENFKELCQAEEENESLCALQSPEVSLVNGFNAITEGHEKAYAAIRKGKTFFVKENWNPEGIAKLLDEEEMRAYEDLAGFSYLTYPREGESICSYINKLGQ